MRGLACFLALWPLGVLGSECHVDSMNMDLLQRQMSIEASSLEQLVGMQKPISAMSQHARTHTHAQIEKPVYWLHIPKTNSGFARSILTLPQMCQNMSEAAKKKVWFSDEVYWEIIVEEECKGDIEDLRYLGIKFGKHSAIGAIFQDYVKGHGLTVLRNPEQRLLSAWNDKYHSWPWALLRRDPHDIFEFASYLQGCTVKLMNRDKVSDKHGTSGHNASEGVSSCGDPSPVTETELQFALRALKEDFNFVGILEEYTNSICLFHTMYGGVCTDKEASNTRTNTSSANSTSDESPAYDISVLNGWVDVYDGLLYSEGLQIFTKKMQDYSLNAKRCNQMCR